MSVPATDTVLRRLTALQDDPWDRYAEVRQSITRPMRKSLGIEGFS